jgi:hypothetical protein
MEDHTEMEEDSTSNVSMLADDGTFIPDTADVTVNEGRHSTKRHRAPENVSDRRWRTSRDVEYPEVHVWIGFSVIFIFSQEKKIIL